MSRPTLEYANVDLYQNYLIMFDCAVPQENTAGPYCIIAVDDWDETIIELVSRHPTLEEAVEKRTFYCQDDEEWDE